MGDGHGGPGGYVNRTDEQLGIILNDYPLEELGPRAFEQLTVALAQEILGAGLEAFGAGKDGGREATYDGPINWSATTAFGHDSWDGYTVVQAKQRQVNDSDPANNATWLRRQIADELEQWTREDSKRQRFPEYLIFVTNVRLSSAPRNGGIDDLNRRIASWWDPEDKKKPNPRARGLRAWKIWHRDQLNAQLTAHDSIRNAFPGMLTVGDVLARLSQLTNLPEPEQLAPVLRAHARSTFIHDRWVNFSESGGENRLSVDDMIIDLPVTSATGPATGSALKEIFIRGDAVLRAPMMSDSGPRHLVITGAPGNGKSTLSRFLVQVYRAQFLVGEELTPMVARLAEDTVAAMTRLNLPLPRNRRWPLRIDLAELADHLNPLSDPSLMRWISTKITQRANIDIQPSLLKRWLRVWPWVIVFDGLDEVTSPDVRRRVLDEIDHFLEEADHGQADIFAIITTRPTGYTEKIKPSEFQQLDLNYLNRTTAKVYGERTINRRFRDDVERREKSLVQFRRAIAEPATEKLTKTPLQVLILTFILERTGSLPPDRYQLFWRYYEAVFDREAAKPTMLATLLANNRKEITQLHERVGQALQKQSELSGDAQARLPLAELRKIAEDRMVEIGHDREHKARGVADKLVGAATTRLVLLVVVEDDSAAFEVRSLQELMAARALSTGTPAAIRSRLIATAPNPHWRNTRVFAAGRLFSNGDDEACDMVLDVVEDFDNSDHWPGWLLPVGPELAAALIDDGLAASTPRWQSRLLDVVLRTLNGHVPRDLQELSVALATVTADAETLLRVREALKAALGGSPSSQAAACMLWQQAPIGSYLPQLPLPLDDSTAYGVSPRPRAHRSLSEIFSDRPCAR